ncbi:MAG: EAL domain-containing protein [Spirochaetales bacterium]|nr:EAL domain-containing protein [Spirochaetales bacterium]
MKKSIFEGLLQPVPQAIRDGLVMVIQILMIGSFACLLENIQLPFYQHFIHTFAGGTIYEVLAFVVSATLGMLSLYTTVSISFCYARVLNGENKFSSFPYVATVLACFFIMIGFFEGNMTDGLFNISMFSGRGMFAALLSAIGGSVLFSAFCRLFKTKRTFYADGTDSAFNFTVSSLLPAACVIVVFCLVNYVIIVVTGKTCIQDLFVAAMNRIFDNMERSYLSGLLFILMSQLMWSVGIHGSNLLEQVAAEKFTEINGSIVSKSFMDNFVLMGGSGTTLALVIAIILFSKRKTTKRLSLMSTGPIIFNINELLVFGLPIVYNVLLIIPFVLVPLIMYTTSYLAVKLGLVGVTVNQIHWTTPFILSGYQTTGSFSGSLLQIVNLFIAVLIYRPFILMYDKKSVLTNLTNMRNLIDTLKQSETSLVPVTLTDLKGPAGMLAKSLVNELRAALGRKDVKLKYQPQYDKNNKCVGAEALLRWEHPVYGFIYPPLVAKIAAESGILWDLEKYIINKSVQALPEFTSVFGDDFKLSVNTTVSTFYNPMFVPYVKKMIENCHIKKDTLCIEITEEMSFYKSEKADEIFRELHSAGCRLALDDFSMGHTSLKYLQKNQFDFVKIDGSIIKDCVENQRSRDIISSIIYLSKSLHFNVVAEYVETEKEKDLLFNLGCWIYQGYLYGKAVSLEEFIKMHGMNGSRGKKLQ